MRGPVSAVVRDKCHAPELESRAFHAPIDFSLPAQTIKNERFGPTSELAPRHQPQTSERISELEQQRLGQSSVAGCCSLLLSAVYTPIDVANDVD